jgi:hypothetical protein
MESKLLDSINKIYQDRGYFELYGTDILIAIIIIYVLLLGTTYFYVLIHRRNIQMNWVEKRCNPLYIPMAGFIVNNENQSKLDATAENFTYCTRNILVSITNDAFAPIYYIFNLITQNISNMSNSVNSVRGMFNKVRSNIGDTASSISNRTLNVSMPLVSQAVNIKDNLSRIHGISTTAVYQLFGLFETTFSIFKFFKNVLIGLLVIMAGGIILLWIMAALPFTSVFAAAAAATSTALYIAILIPFLIVIVLISIIFNYNGGGSPPNVPGKQSSCFDKNTKIEMDDGNYKNISDIKVGDFLKGKNKVTATMISNIGNNKMYQIDNILVTGCHKVLVNNYKNTLVYCLNTENKIIDINGYIFMDWDELDSDEIKILKKNSNDSLNKLFNNGISGSTKINTVSGEKYVKDINIGDNLGNNNYVLAKINVLPDGLYVIEQENIKITLNLSENKSFSFYRKIECNDLYQIKTTLGYYKINKLKIKDYDSVIEKYLE